MKVKETIGGGEFDEAKGGKIMVSDSAVDDSFGIVFYKEVDGKEQYLLVDVLRKDAGITDKSNPLFSQVKHVRELVLYNLAKEIKRVNS